ncbi:MAG: PLP-dependent aminotransferase family protein [Rhodospirillales bacterium]|nr:PLP-dependent aminotransferase family protein [Rhodospirillales bacterium]
MSKSREKSPLLSVAIDKGAAASLQIQIFDQVRDAILAGRLAPGTRLPASRTLAGELAVSRNTVLAAFERLYAEGYTEGRVGSGTRVSQILPEELLSARKNRHRSGDTPSNPGKLSLLSSQLDSYRHRGRERGRRAFRPGLPDLDSFPFAVWSRLVGRFWRNPRKDLVFAGDLSGYRPLRDVVAAYLGAVRGLHCTGENIVITSGAQQALDLVARTIIDPGDRVWVENPGYTGLRNTLLAAGAELVHVPVDAGGMAVATARKLAPDAVLAAVTPSHQYPLGITMSLSRRLELLDWARERGAWILEDDYDSDFRYSGKPLSALQGLDQSGRVIYVGTFSKILFSTLRLGYVVLPDHLLDPFLSVRAALDDHPALALQPALAEFIEAGHFAAHLRRLRKLYGERQEIMIDALVRHGDGLFTAEPHEAGMHVIAGMTDQVMMTDQAASARADQADLVAPALSGYYADPTVDRRGLVLGYAGLTEREINRDVQKLVRRFTG